MKRRLFGRKAMACLLTLAMLFSFIGGFSFSPGVVEAEEAGEFKLVVGHYRGLNQELSVPVTVQNAADLVALEFKVETHSSFALDVAIKNVDRGKDLPDGAQLTWSGAGHGNVKIAIYMYEEEDSFSGDGELVRITYTHKGTEQTYRQPVDLLVPIASVGAWARDNDNGAEQNSFGGIKAVPITQSSIRDGQIMVAIMYGDMNKDDEVTISDAVLALQASVGELELTPQLKDAGDVKRDPGTEYSSITVYDALLIARHSLEIIKWFPVNRNWYDTPSVIDDDDPATAPFDEAPSGIWIGDQKMMNTRTTIGGTVDFTVKFDDPVHGHIRVQIGDLIKEKEMDGREETVTMRLDKPEHNLYAGTGYHEVSAYQYNTVTYETGVPLRRFVKVVDPDKVINGDPVYPTPELEITDIQNGQLELAWGPVLAASKIDLLQSFDHGDEKTWRSAETVNGPILSYAESAIVAGFDDKRGYYYKLKIEGGVHAGESNVASFKRMSGEAIAEQAGDDLYVSILYTGRFEELNLAAAGDFMLVKDGVEIKVADHLEIIKPGSMGIKLLFTGTEAESFSVEYNEAAGSLDLDKHSYVLTEDSVDVGDGGTINEVTVTSRAFFLNAVENEGVNKVVLADDITLEPGDSFTINDLDIIIDGYGHGLEIAAAEIITINVDQNARFSNIGFGGGGTFALAVAEDSTLTLQGIIEIDGTTVTTTGGAGTVITGNNATITGFDDAVLVFAGTDYAIKKLDLEGDLDVTTDDPLSFEEVVFNVPIESDLENTFEQCTFNSTVSVSSANASTFTNCEFNEAVTVQNTQAFTPGNQFNAAVENVDGDSDYSEAIFNGPVTNTAGNGIYADVKFNDTFSVIAGTPILTGAEFDSISFADYTVMVEDVGTGSAEIEIVTIPTYNNLPAGALKLKLDQEIQGVAAGTAKTVAEWDAVDGLACSKTEEPAGTYMITFAPGEAMDADFTVLLFDTEVDTVNMKVEP